MYKIDFISFGQIDNQNFISGLTAKAEFLSKNKIVGLKHRGKLG
tara:strand:- start:1274 stop:1405 length:132 start_codon:yes stop_codon:yes gene_type:complete